MFADDYSLTASGIGGDPLHHRAVHRPQEAASTTCASISARATTTGTGTIARALPNGLHGLTNNHDWATVRKIGSINLLVHATNNLRFSFEYYRNTRDGVTFTTRSLDYFGSSATWGSFARANPYYLIAPLNESFQPRDRRRRLHAQRLDLSLPLGYQTFHRRDQRTERRRRRERSINIDDPTTANELVNGVSWTDSRKLTTPVSEFSYTGKLTPKLEARGGYMFYRYSGPASLDMSFDGIARTNSGGTTDAPYAVSLVDARQRHRAQQRHRPGLHLQSQGLVEYPARLPLLAFHRR